MAALAFVACARLIAGMIVTRDGFKPRYSKYVSEQVRVSLEKAVDAGVVLIEARVLSGEADGSFLRPPLVLEDSSGSRLRLPVLNHGEEVERREAPLGDNTYGILYRAGDPVVFVGMVGVPEAPPTYRDTGKNEPDELIARLDWLAFKGSTREEVVEALRQRDPSVVPVTVLGLLLVASWVLSAVAFAGH